MCLLNAESCIGLPQIRAGLLSLQRSPDVDIWWRTSELELSASEGAFFDLTLADLEILVQAAKLMVSWLGS
jgi:hypothetical protein